MAGAGYKLFNTGDVLSASDVNTYLMQQTVMSFASSAARTTALASVLAEGMVTYLQDTNVVEIYTGSSWVSLDDPNAIQNSIVDAKGDLISATADNTPARLAVGTNGQYLQADSTTATGLKWATVSSSPTFVGASAYNANFSQAFTSGTAVTIAFPNEDFDTNSFHDNSTNNSRLTVPSGGAGKYLISANIDLNGVSAYYICAIRHFNSSGSSLATNGLNRQFAQNAGGNNFAGGTQAWIANAAVGDYFTFTVQLGQDGTLSSNYARFAITYLGA